MLTVADWLIVALCFLMPYPPVSLAIIKATDEIILKFSIKRHICRPAIARGFNNPCAKMLLNK